MNQRPSNLFCLGIKSTSSRLSSISLCNARNNRSTSTFKPNPSRFHNDMPPSVSNPTGSNNPSKTPYGHHTSFPKDDFPQYGGKISVIYRSRDQKIVAGAATESGTATLTYPCDEFFYVTNGWVDVKIHGGDEFRLNTGDFIYLTKGTKADFVFGPGFTNAAVFIDSEPVTLV